MQELIKRNWIYIVWLSFYVILFSVITNGIALLFYIVSVPLAFSPIAESLWRKVSGIRPLRIRLEKDRLLPLFKEVYLETAKNNPNLSKAINLYIQENMDINAFAFGRRTLVITRGSIELLSDEGLKGLMAHELGHFANNDTVMSLLAIIANFPLSIIIKIAANFKDHFDKEAKGGIVMGAFKIIYDTIYYFFTGLKFIGDLILMRSSRQSEFSADNFAYENGFGKDLTDVLIEIYKVSIDKPKSVKEQLKSTHPPITIRIERLEKVI